MAGIQTLSKKFEKRVEKPTSRNERVKFWQNLSVWGKTLLLKKDKRICELLRA